MGRTWGQSGRRPPDSLALTAIGDPTPALDGQDDAGTGLWVGFLRQSPQFLSLRELSHVDAGAGTVSSRARMSVFWPCRANSRFSSRRFPLSETLLVQDRALE